SRSGHKTDLDTVMDQTLAVEVGAHAGTVEEIGGPPCSITPARIRPSTYSPLRCSTMMLAMPCLWRSWPRSKPEGPASMTATWVCTLFPPSGDPERSLIPRGSALGHFGPTPFFSRYREWQ